MLHLHTQSVSEFMQALLPTSSARLDDQLVKITLERAHAQALVRALRCQDVHAASVFPDARGVAELVREVYLTAPKEASMVVSVDDDAVHEAG